MNNFNLMIIFFALKICLHFLNSASFTITLFYNNILITNALVMYAIYIILLFCVHLITCLLIYAASIHKIYLN